MPRNREEIKVGAVVIAALILFVLTLVFVGGVNLFRKKKVVYTTYFKFAGGLEPGSYVRFGGLKVGNVQAAEIDPSDSTRIRIRLLVNAETPVRANSRARISTLGFLGENYVEISPGTRDAAKLRPDGEIPADEIVQLADVFNNVNNITRNANNANQLITNLNGVVNVENRQHLEASLSNIDAILADSRAPLKKTLTNLESASSKLVPAIENANTTITRAKSLAGNMNSLVEENRKEVHQSLLRLQDSLLNARQLIDDLDDLLVNNRENFDEALENIRATSQNLKEFSDTIKQRPFSLIRIRAEKDREPPLGK